MSPPPSAPSSVLVVDDEEAVADVQAKYLDDDYEVLTAYGGAAALDVLDDPDTDVDVVLLDRRMPDLHGDEVLARIRERELPVQVAMVTAVDPEMDVLSLGFDAYITKPIGRSELRGLVDRLLERRHYDDEVRTLYRLLDRRAVLETHHSEATLSTDERYVALCDRIDALEAEIEATQEHLDHEDFDALLNQL